MKTIGAFKKENGELKEEIRILKSKVFYLKKQNYLQQKINGQKNKLCESEQKLKRSVPKEAPPPLPNCQTDTMQESADSSCTAESVTVQHRKFKHSPLLTFRNHLNHTVFTPFRPPATGPVLAPYSPVIIKIERTAKFRRKVDEIFSKLVKDGQYCRSAVALMDSLPPAVPPEFGELWVNLERTPSFPSVPASHQPAIKPVVEWHNLRPHLKKNLPEPAKFPVSGVSPDPEFYQPTCTWHKGTKFTQHEPFGTLPGLMTSLGVVTMPTEPVHGYVWTGDSWVIHAEMSRERPRGGTGGQGCLATLACSPSSGRTRRTA